MLNAERTCYPKKQPILLPTENGKSILAGSNVDRETAKVVGFRLPSFPQTVRCASRLHKARFDLSLDVYGQLGGLPTSQPSPLKSPPTRGVECCLHQEF